MHRQAESAMTSDDDLIPPHERPFGKEINAPLGYEYVTYQSLDEARADPNSVVIFVGDYGGQVYLTCPVSRIRCSQQTLVQLLAAINEFSWGDGEEMYFERVRPDQFVPGGMGGGVVENDVWLHPEFRRLFEVDITILPEVADVLHGLSDDILPGVLQKLNAYFEFVAAGVDVPLDALRHVLNICHCLVRYAGARAEVLLPALRRVQNWRPLQKSDYHREGLAEQIDKLERAAQSKST